MQKCEDFEYFVIILSKKKILKNLDCIKNRHDSVLEIPACDQENFQ